MRLLAALGCLLCVSPAFALDMPPRKAGLWELKLSFDNGAVPGQTMRQCVDAKTDALLRSNFSGSPQQTCDKQEITRAGDTVIVDSVCRFAGVTTTSHAAITGSFDSAYTMHVTTRSHGGPPAPGADGENRMSIAAKWLGPCAKGQRAGDMMLPTGMTVNILDLKNARGMSHLPPR